MKGAIFNALQEFVEQGHGYQVWDDALSNNTLPSHGIYTSTKQYDDSELFTIVGYLSERLEVPIPDLVRAFGEFLFPLLMPQAPQEAQNAPSLRAFLMMVDELIHVEVKKLYKDAQLPDFNYDDHIDDKLTMIYQSPRKLCFLSEGLILGAAQHFGETVSLSQPVCMHQGGEHCEIEVVFNGK
ncbi:MULTISPECIES: heme NO-binding domain-containing protein [Pseudoalteromonas]|uniref:heme NO-binding domain-containing protein n=1 Tax=Pseudoalteromonas TaxID=53246 RepID=UPI000CF71CCD|nr:heme NO-binding domain-containing protein [Pseudoalteromonas sp. T1lg24]